MSSTPLNRTILALSGAVMVFFITSFCLLVLYQTVDATAPVQPTDSVDYIVPAAGNNVLVSSRSYTNVSSTAVTLYYIIFREAEPDRKFILGGETVAEKGDFTVLKTTLLPRHIYGRWCSRVTMHWNAPFSLRNHRADATTLCFEVPNNG